MNNTHYSFPVIHDRDHFTKRAKETIAFTFNNDKTIPIKGKIELDGTSIAIVGEYKDGNLNIYCQNRDEILNEDNDTYKFLEFFKEQEKYYRSYFEIELNHKGKYGRPKAVVIFGIFAGKDVKQGNGVGDIDNFFAPFLIGHKLKNTEAIEYIIDDYELNRLYRPYSKDFRCFPVTLVKPLTRLMKLDEASLEAFKSKIDALNDEVKENCPFAKLLGKEGTGLGYVWNIPCPYLSIMPYFFKC